MEKAKKPTFSYGFVIAAACFGIQAIGIGTYTTYGVFFNPISQEFGWSRATISGASSLSFFLMGLFGILVGRLNDRIGPRKMMAVTGFLFGLGYLLMSWLGAVWQLYLFYGIVVGIGFSSVDVIPLSTTARWFARKRGTMTGLVKVGTGVGQLAIPLVASMLITAYGWRISYAFIGGVVLLSLVSIAQLLERDPGRKGLLPDRGKASSGEIPSGESEGLSLRETLRTRQFWIICAANLTVVFCIMTIMVHIVPHARDMRVSVAGAAGILSTIGGVSTIGRFMTGFAADRFGSKKTMIACFVLLLSALLWLQAAEALWMIYLFAVVYGTAHGGFFTAISLIVAEFFGIKAHGVLFGIAAFCGTVGGSIGPFVAGYIFDITAGYALAFLLCALVSAIGLALMTRLKPIEARAAIH